MSTAIAPTIACPSWCVVSMQRHLADLETWGDGVIHWSSESNGVSHSRLDIAEVGPSEAPLVFLSLTGDGITLEEALALARRLLDVVEEAKG